jgi:hypothetical protein
LHRSLKILNLRGGLFGVQNFYNAQIVNASIILITKAFIILIGGNLRNKKYNSVEFSAFSWISVKASGKDGTSTRRQQTGQIDVNSK